PTPAPAVAAPPPERVGAAAALDRRGTPGRPGPIAARAERPEGVGLVARPVSRRAPAPPADREPRGSFTLTRDGESLADVARRVYGSDEEARTLWLANRDLLDR